MSKGDKENAESGKKENARTVIQAQFWNFLCQVMKKSNNNNTKLNRPALFLDRDGVINNDYGHVHSKDKFDFIPGIFELAARANLAGYLTVIVTNQAGIGKGLYSLEQFKILSIWMCEEFKQNGTTIDAIYYSPFHPSDAEGVYLKDEPTRKPGAGMFLEATKDLNINIYESIMVGDKLSDMKAAILAKITNNYLFSPFCELQIHEKLISRVNQISNFSQSHFPRS